MLQNNGPDTTFNQEQLTQTENVGDNLDSQNGLSPELNDIYEEITFGKEDKELLDFLNSLKPDEKQEFISIFQKNGIDIFIEIYNEYSGLSLDNLRVRLSIDIKIINEQVDKQEEQVDKQEEQVDKQEEQVVEGIKQTSTEVKEFQQKFSDTFENINDLKGLDENLQISIKELKNSQLNKIEENQDKLILELSKDNNLEELLNLIYSKNPQKLESFVDSLGDIDIDGVLKTKINKFKEANKEKFSSSVVREEVLKIFEETIIKEPGIEINGNKGIAKLGNSIDAKTDFSKHPPKRVITNGNYEFESEPFLGPLLRPSVEYKKRVGDLQNERKDVTVEGEKLIEEGKEKFGEIEDIKLQMNEVKNEFGEESDIYKDLVDRLKDAENELDKIQKQIEQKHKRIEEIDADILKTKNEYIGVVQESQEAYAEALKQRDEKKKMTLRFLDSIGFDEIPQSATNAIIERINTGSEKSTFGFRNKINLANGNLGTNLDGNLNSFGIKEMKFFAEFVNILLSGEKGKPIDADSMEHGLPVFKDENGEVIVDKDLYVKKIMGTNPLSTMNKNINKFKVFGNEGNKEVENENKKK